MERREEGIGGGHPQRLRGRFGTGLVLFFDKEPFPGESRGPDGAAQPRVGGVGPTSIAMLFKNTVEAAERRAG